MSTDQLMVEIARLSKRVEVLEKAAFASADEYVEGWTRAAKIVGVDAKTCKRRYEVGEFPKPCRVTTVSRKTVASNPLGGDFDKPTWRRADLLAYAEGK